MHIVIGTGGAGFTKNAIGITPANDHGLGEYPPVIDSHCFHMLKVNHLLDNHLLEHLQESRLLL